MLEEVYTQRKLCWLAPQVLYNDIYNDFLNYFLRHLNEGHEFIIPWITLIISPTLIKRALAIFQILIIAVTINEITFIWGLFFPRR